MNSTELKDILKRLVRVRTDLLADYPFFGRLLMNLRLGFAECSTAYTDMTNIVFDPDFAKRLKDTELAFVYIHEVFHCVLKHCIRGKSLDSRLYNIACDIVVNSMILEMFGVPDMKIDGCEVMHLTPDGKEGRGFSAEEVYYLLLSESPEKLLSLYGSSLLDSHLVWSMIEKSGLSDLWDEHIRKAVKACGTGSGIPSGFARYLKEINHSPKTNWRQLLHDFIQFDKYDYSYITPDKRFGGDMILPSFCETDEGDRAENLWFFVDTSASVTDTALAEAYLEIKDAIDQIGSLSGVLCFFDTKISKPEPFENIQELMEITPVGGGGTDFHIIFDYVRKLCEDKAPALVIIITDGYADFPEEDTLPDIPVLWIIVNSSINPPYGQCVHIEQTED